jgi:hypothetical protein
MSGRRFERHYCPVSTLKLPRGVYLPSLRESKPEDKNELEGVVEGEPVNGANGALEDGQERENDPVLYMISGIL